MSAEGGSEKEEEIVVVVVDVVVGPGLMSGLLVVVVVGDVFFLPYNRAWAWSLAAPLRGLGCRGLGWRWRCRESSGQ